MARLRKSDAVAAAGLIAGLFVLLGLVVKAFLALARSAGWINAIAGFAGIMMIASGFSEPDAYAATILFLIGVPLLIAPFVGMHIRGKQRTEHATALIRLEAARVEAIERMCAGLVMHHAQALGRRREQLVYSDDYGIEHTEKWIQEQEKFFRGVILPALADIRRNDPDEDIFSRVSPLIEDAAQRAKPKGIATTPLSQMSPAEFEMHCADVVRRCGWNARVMGGSGDQGVDVVADRGGVRVVFQCKLYSRAVNNSAVQEIVAGKVYQRAHFAAVVSNQDYTPGARTLAKSNRVALLHPAGISALLAKIDTWREQKVKAA